MPAGAGREAAGCSRQPARGAAGRPARRAAAGGGRHGKQRRHDLTGIDGGSLRGEQPQAPRTSENAGAQQGAEAAAASGHTSAMGAGRVGTSVRQSGGSGAFSWLDGQAAVRPAHGERRWSVPRALRLRSTIARRLGMKKLLEFDELLKHSIFSLIN